MMRVLTSLLLSAAVLMVACTNAEKEQQKVGAGVFFDYRIWGEEDREEVTCMVQFRMGGPEGTSFLLPDPAGVTLDGTALKPDSAKLSGAFYELIRPLSEFQGRHTIVFTDAGGRQHPQDFDFSAFEVAELPAKVSAGSFVIQLSGFPDGEAPVRLALTDTAFATNDVNEIVEAQNGRIEVTQAMLDKLKPGPIAVEIFRETEKLVNQETLKGKIWVSYGLRKEFELVR